MNAKKKGKILEKKARNILESQGYHVEQANPKLIYIPKQKRMISKAHDFFGLFDLIAVPPEPQGTVRFIQVSIWDNRAEKAKKLTVANFPKPGSLRQELWLYLQQGRNSHFRISNHSENFEWRGACEMPVKDGKEKKHEVPSV